MSNRQQIVHAPPVQGCNLYSRPASGTNDVISLDSLGRGGVITIRPQACNVWVAFGKLTDTINAAASSTLSGDDISPGGTEGWYIPDGTADSFDLGMLRDRISNGSVQALIFVSDNATGEIRILRDSGTVGNI